MIDIPADGSQIQTSNPDRPANIKQVTPNGICGKCLMPKLTRGLEKVCPNCDTEASPASGLVSVATDPGTQAFKKVVIGKDADGNEIVDMVPDEEAFKKMQEQGGQTVEQQGRPTVATPQKYQPTPAGVPTMETPISMITRLLEAYKARPVNDMGQAKKLFALRKQIDKLRDSIISFEHQGDEQ